MCVLSSPNDVPNSYIKDQGNVKVIYCIRIKSLDPLRAKKTFIRKQELPYHGFDYKNLISDPKKSDNCRVWPNFISHPSLYAFPPYLRVLKWSRTLFLHFKRQQWKRCQLELIENCNNNKEGFWKKIGRLGVGFERKQNILLKFKKDGGSISNNIKDEKLKWKTRTKTN